MKSKFIKTAEPEFVRPSRAEAEEAVRTLIRWAGDNPERDGLARDAATRGASRMRSSSAATTRIPRRS